MRGLTKDDFRLFDQGRVQTISHFEEISPRGIRSAPAAAPSTPATPSPQAGAEQRNIAFYFDEFNSSEADLMQARDAADHYFATALLPSDHVAIFTPEKMLTSFTADPRQLHEALVQLHASTRGGSSEHLCPDLSDYQAYQILQSNDAESDAWRVALTEAAACPIKSLAGASSIDPTRPNPAAMQAIRMMAQRITDRAQNLTRANLQQFENVVKYVAQAPEPRSVVLVSPGFLSQSEQFALNRIIDSALRAQVVINSLDPKGLAVLMRESHVSANTSVLPDPRASQARYRLDASKEFVGADVLAEMAEGTGGNFFHSDNDLQAGFATLTGDSPHYILGFSPQKVKWDGTFHTLKVSFTTREKGRTLQARRGYFAVNNSFSPQQFDVAKTAPAPTPESRSSGEAASSPVTPQNETAIASEHSAEASASRDLNPATSSVANLRTSEDSAPRPDLAAGRPNANPLHLHRGTSRITVDQLERFLSDASGKSDAELAKRLTTLELTERLDSSTLRQLAAGLPGEQSRQVLAAQADFAAFFKPPASAVALRPPPSADDQLQWLKSATNYAANALHKLPNFFATRDVSRFADSPASQVTGTFYSYQPLHAIDQYQATVLFRDGKQVSDEHRESRGPNSNSPGLVIAGEFGPILGVVLTDASKSSITWDRWEPGAGEPLAVYRFAVPRNRSHYEVEYCCLNGIGLYKAISAYHGEIAIEPATGSILRIAIRADLKDAYPLTRADLLVEYGQVEIGGNTYICPLHSVAIMNAYIRPPDVGSQLPELVSRDMLGSTNAFALPVQTLINDIVFKQYHVFRSDSRILSAPD